MAQTISVPQPVGADLAFEHEWLDVYIVAREFQSLVPQLVPRRGFASLAISSIAPARRCC
jgi:hypothetical protein